MATMPAAQKRTQAKVTYDAFLAGCPSRQLLARISDKWVALVLAALGGEGPHPVMGGIEVWAEAHMDEVLANRQTHDARVTERGGA